MSKLLQCKWSPLWHIRFVHSLDPSHFFLLTQSNKYNRRKLSLFHLNPCSEIWSNPVFKTAIIEDPALEIFSNNWTIWSLNKTNKRKILFHSGKKIYVFLAMVTPSVFLFCGEGRLIYKSLEKKEMREEYLWRWRNWGSLFFSFRFSFRFFTGEGNKMWERQKRRETYSSVGTAVGGGFECSTTRYDFFAKSSTLTIAAEKQRKWVVVDTRFPHGFFFYLHCFRILEVLTTTASFNIGATSCDKSGYFLRSFWTSSTVAV